jgi:hypothetical protein
MDDPRIGFAPHPLFTINPSAVKFGYTAAHHLKDADLAKWFSMPPGAISHTVSYEISVTDAASVRCCIESIGSNLGAAIKAAISKESS